MRKYWGLISSLIVVVIVGGVYLNYQTKDIYGGDAGDLVSAAYVGGIAHPPGYPLYVILGNLLSKLPISTVAWRVTLLSSITMTLAAFFIYRTLVLWFKRPLIAAIATLSFAFSYLAWLFASVPEVFGLYVLLVSVSTYIVSKIYFTKKPKVIRKYFYLLSFITGLSLTHHHAILFFWPSWIYLLYRKIRHGKVILHPWRIILLSITLFIFGLLSYIDSYLAAKHETAIIWNRPDTLAGFVRLVTRSQYGSFVVGSFVANSPIYRIGQVINFFDTIYYDFSILGTCLFVLGFTHLFFRKRDLFWFTFLAIGIGGLGFSVYASFPINVNFVIGTYERFILPTYLLLTIPLTAGILASVGAGEKLFSWLFQRSMLDPFFIIVIEALFIIYPVYMFKANLPKIAPLKNDMSGVHLGEDILDMLPPHSILALSYDTELFDTQYVYYTNRARFQSIAFFHFDKLAKKDYRTILAHQYPDLVFPQSNVDGYDYLRLFIEANIDKHPFFGVEYFDLPKGLVWQQTGLLIRAYREEKKPKLVELLAENEALWIKYHNPLQSHLLFDYHLLARDIFRVYGTARRELGVLYLDDNQAGEAERHFREALQLEPWLVDNRIFMGEASLKAEHCRETESYWQSILDEDPIAVDMYPRMIRLYKDCFKDPKKAEVYETKIKDKQKKDQVPLKAL